MTLSSKPHILQLVALLQAHGIRDVVLCPGSRNAPLTHTICQCGAFRLHSVTDERSAGFFALGLTHASGLPTAVCVTSGSALLNLQPAAAEALYQQVPLILISADRPAAWIGQMDGQTLPQPDALGQMVRTSVNLPEAHTPEEEWHANRLANEAILEATHRGGGPVHINVPISEPLYEFPTESLPLVRRIVRWEHIPTCHAQEWRELWQGAKRRLVLIGQLADSEALVPAMRLLGQMDCVLMAENLSNTHHCPEVMPLTDELIRSITEEESEALRPDLVVTLGGHIVSKPLKQWLRRFPPRCHVHISAEGQIADLFRGALTHVLEGQAEVCLEALAPLVGEDAGMHPYTSMWEQHRHATSIGTDIPAPLAQLLANLPDNAVLHLANSSAVRMAQKVQLPPTTRVRCNRGVNGIEGSLSAAVGHAVGSPSQQHFVIIGDLSFHYDQNALWHHPLPQNLHILLLNSGGGAIFHTLPIPDDPVSRQHICATHHTEVQHLCQHYGIRYLQGDDQLKAFITSKDTILWEIETGNK